MIIWDFHCILAKSKFMRFFYLFIVSFLGFVVISRSQVINGYAKVSALAAGTTLTVTNVDESAGATATFTAGMEVMVMQMQDSTLGNVTNTASFGDLGGIRNAGNFEYGVIVSVTRPSGILTTITLAANLTKPFSIGSNASLQIVTFPTLGSPDFTTTNDIVALPWNGNIGGIVTFKVNGNLTLGHLINVKGSGFRGGILNNDDGSGCENNVYFSTANNKYSGKGEGIFKNTNTDFNIGKGKLMNAGGGGIIHNGGGGGGGNFSAGGNGGVGYNTGGCTGSAGGVGGMSLSSVLNLSRLFMGGGGGAGQQNNSVGTAGGNGGGIIFIKADTIKSGVGCGVLIDASGNATPNAGNDGAGGAGAGGSVYLDAKDFKIDVSCPLSIKGDGGNGGSTINAEPHGGGGGGGQGIIIFATARPTTNVISTVLNGVGGNDNNGAPSTKTSTNGGGISNSGIFQNQGPLPIELIYFYAEKQKEKVELAWATASEKNNKKFIISKSSNLYNWEKLEEVNGQMVSTTQLNYKIYDYTPYKGLTYYMLEQEDMDGKKTKFDLQVVDFSNDVITSAKIYPNPSNGSTELIIENINKSNADNLSVKNIVGKTLLSELMDKGNGTYSLNISHYPDGIYLIDFSSKVLKPIKFIVKK
jgi:Secretion system C-terminal sorting domain